MPRTQCQRSPSSLMAHIPLVQYEFMPIERWFVRLKRGKRRDGQDKAGPADSVGERSGLLACLESNAAGFGHGWLQELPDSFKEGSNLRVMCTDFSFQPFQFSC